MKVPAELSFADINPVKQIHDVEVGLLFMSMQFTGNPFQYAVVIRFKSGNEFSGQIALFKIPCQLRLEGLKQFFLADLIFKAEQKWNSVINLIDFNFKLGI
jgi:hypothetical protein